jgi:predicted RNA-binding Zn-ribbon protein involved in translation (DUF1610 family)
MFNKKEYDKNYKKGFCPDCGKQIWFGSIRCKSCARKEQYRLAPESNPQFGKKGELSPTWKHGENKCIDCGKEIDFYAVRCQRHAKLEQYKNPENHPLFIDGRSFEPYPLEFTESLKELIRKRDNHECQNCGLIEEESLIVFGHVLHVHHIDYNKQNCNENNLITLCGSCNTRANFNREYWMSFYQQKVGVK